jgi:hypothetical protein
VDQDNPWLLLSVLSLSARSLRRKRAFYIENFVATSNLSQMYYEIIIIIIIIIVLDFLVLKGKGKAIPLQA